MDTGTQLSPYVGCLGLRFGVWVWGLQVCYALLLSVGGLQFGVYVYSAGVWDFWGVDGGAKVWGVGLGASSVLRFAFVYGGFTVWGVCVQGKCLGLLGVYGVECVRLLQQPLETKKLSPTKSTLNPEPQNPKPSLSPRRFRGGHQCLQGGGRFRV